MRCVCVCLCVCLRQCACDGLRCVCVCLCVCLRQCACDGAKSRALQCLWHFERSEAVKVCVRVRGVRADERADGKAA
jgi:hypothetical protein